MRTACWGAFVLLLGCGGGVESDDVAADCDPVADTGCALGEHCRVIGDGTLRCLPRSAASSRPAGECAADSCGPGEACAVVEGARGCHPVCALEGEGECACAYRVAVSGPWGVCPAACALGDDRCPAGATCAPSPVLPYPICVAIGDAGPGDACTQAPCGPGLGCLSREDTARCERLCRPAAADCPVPASCGGVIEGVEGVGYCVSP